MSTFERACIGSFIAGENLVGDMYEALTINSSGRVEKADAATELIVGILAEAPVSDPTGNAVSVALINGSSKLLVKANAAISAGQALIPTTTAGRVAGVDVANIPSKNMSIGIALEAASAAGDVIQFACVPVYT